MAERPRRPLLLTALAVLLAVESVAAVAVHAAAPRGSVATAGAARSDLRGADVPTPAVAYLAAGPADRPADDARPATGAFARADGREPAIAKPAGAGGIVLANAARTTRTSLAPAPASRATGGGSGGTTTRARFSGTNHVWIPAWGMSKRVAGFPCSRSAAPGHLVYRWGCAGRNNVYLFGHASSVFEPLHDAYVRGRLSVGMRVYYADGAGTVRTYAVRQWKLLRPDGDISWAIDAQPVRSLTLQTCVGPRSLQRLVVRLTEVTD